MSHYFYELLGLMAVFSIMVVSPGADFALVVRQSIVHGRRSAIITSFGIGTSLLFHISYTVLGLGLIVSKSLYLFGMLKWAGAAYLFYLGVKALRAPAPEAPAGMDESEFSQAALCIALLSHGLRHQCSEPESRAVLPVAVLGTGQPRDAHPHSGRLRHGHDNSIDLLVRRRIRLFHDAIRS